MDDLTKKRVERDMGKLPAVGARLTNAIDAASDAVRDMDALNAEYLALVPEWAAPLIAPMNMLLGTVIGRLRVLGAPDDFYVQLIEHYRATQRDPKTPPMWPLRGADHFAGAPAWVIEPADIAACTCGHEHPGGARHQALQCDRLLQVIYLELSEIVEMHVNGDTPEVHEMTMKLMAFQANVALRMMSAL